jgi:hypothetical protein
MNLAAKLCRWSHVLLAALSAALGSCASSSMPRPQLVLHPSSAYSEVPYPPPAALVEVVPPSPGSLAVWLDGYWTWQGQFYVWMRGGWVLAPAGGRFAQWQSFYTQYGVLMFAPGAWYGPGGTRVRPPEILLSAYTPPNETTAEFQTAR